MLIIAAGWLRPHYSPFIYVKDKRYFNLVFINLQQMREIILLFRSFDVVDLSDFLLDVFEVLNLFEGDPSFPEVGDGAS